MPEQKYFGCRVRQREDAETTNFFVFVAKVKDVKQWTGTRRTADIPSGTQRVLRPTRVKAVRRFLDSNPINTIANSVLLAFEPGKAAFTPFADDCIAGDNFYNNCPPDQLVWGFLDFQYEEGVEEHLRPALIVDGQHRVEGIATYEDENLPILVVGLIDATHEEQAFQFIVVNDKAVRVSTDNVKSIIADFDEDSLQTRLFKAGIRYGELSPVLKDINDMPDSPFRHLLKWDYNRDGTHLVSLTAIEQGLKMLNAVFGNITVNDEDSEIAIYCAIWRGVKSCYEDLWGQENKFMTKVNLAAMNEMILQRLKTLWSMEMLDIFSIKDVEASVAAMWKSVPSKYWSSEWMVTPQDTTGFRGLIQSDLELIAENIRLKKPWYEGLQLTQAPELSDGN